MKTINEDGTNVGILLFNFSKQNVYSVSVIRFGLQKNVHADTRFSTDTGER